MTRVISVAHNLAHPIIKLIFTWKYICSDTFLRSGKYKCDTSFSFLYRIFKIKKKSIWIYKLPKHFKILKWKTKKWSKYIGLTMQFCCSLTLFACKIQRKWIKSSTLPLYPSLLPFQIWVVVLWTGLNLPNIKNHQSYWG